MATEIIERSDAAKALDSVHFINEIIADTEDEISAEDKKDHVKRNVEHLQIVKGGSYADLTSFSASDIAAIDEAISVGNTFISSL